MMYHFMFGLRGASVVVVAPSATGWGVDSPPVGSFFCSSNIGVAFSRCCRLMSPEESEQGIYAAVNDEVDDPEVRGENEDGDDNDRRRASNFLPTGRRHLAHLGAHVVVEGLDLVGPGLHPVREVTAG